MMNINADIKLRLESGKRVFCLDVSVCSADSFTILYGQSGSGKSLTLKCMAGIILPDSGRITVGERVLFDSAKKINIPARDRRLGYVFQDYALFPHLSVLENIGFAFKRGFRAGMQKDDIRRVMDVLGILDIEDIAGALPGEISGGQKQRVAIARALILRPDAILLDEPFSALDTTLRAKLREELKSLQASYGIPVVLITHDPADIDAFPGTVVNYSAGKICKALPSVRTQTYAPLEALCSR
jgi:molybdate transport system ATP-binding protein